MIYRETESPDFWQLAKIPGDGYLDPWGPLDCTCHSLARAIERHFEGIKPTGIAGVWPPTGGFVRKVTRNPDGTLDRSGGTNHSEMQAVCVKYYGFALDVRNGMDWDAFLAEIAKTRGAMVSVRYRLIAPTALSGQRNFYANHEMFCESYNPVAKTLRMIDPLCGPAARTGIHHGAADYPVELIKKAAGELTLDVATGRALGYGKVYAAFTQATGDAPVTSTFSIARTPYPAPKTWFVKAGTTLSGYSPKHPGAPVRTITFAHDSSAHAAAEVSISWPGNPHPPVPHGGPFLEVTDGSYGPADNAGLQLYIVKALVRVP